MTLTKHPTLTQEASDADSPVFLSSEEEAAYKEDVLNSLLAEFGSAPVESPAPADISAPEASPEVPEDASPIAPAETEDTPPKQLIIDGVDFSEFLRDAPASAAEVPTVEASAPKVSSAAKASAPAPRVQPKPRQRGGIALRVLAFLLVLATVLFLYTQTMQNHLSTASFDDVSRAVLDTLELTDMQQADAQMLRRLYGFAPSEMAGCTLYYPTSNMGACEVLIVKLSDLSQQQSVRDAIAARLQTQTQSFEGYGVEQSALLSRAVTEVQGNFILFVVHPDAAAARQAFLKAL